MPVSFRSAVVALVLAFMGLTSSAAVFKDAHLQRWLDAENLSELERAAHARLKQDPQDSEAQAALALASALAFDAKRWDASAQTMQAYVSREPEGFLCHYALGTVLGAQAVNGGVWKAVGLAGRIKAALQRALALSPASYEARSALAQFYLVVPGMAGGSVGKARALEQEIREGQPEQAKLLRAYIALQGEQWGEMERELLSMQPATDPKLQADQRSAFGQLARQWMKDKQFDKTRDLFERLQREQPREAMGPYGLGRLALAMQQPEEALRQFERARKLAHAEGLPLDQQVGNAWLDLGDKAQARAAYERFLKHPRARPRNLEDVRKRLAEL